MTVFLKQFQKILDFEFETRKSNSVGQNENGQSEPVKRVTNQRPSEEEARRQREERIKLRRSRKAE